MDPDLGLIFLILDALSSRTNIFHLQDLNFTFLFIHLCSLTNVKLMFSSTSRNMFHLSCSTDGHTTSTCYPRRICGLSRPQAPCISPTGTLPETLVGFLV
jgi:hypothetical protein